MLKGDELAKTSNGAKGETFKNERYEKDICGQMMNIFNTAGLNEGASGTISPKKAIENIITLICQLEKGVSLLVYVVQATRIQDSVKENYQLFYETLCNMLVPIVLIVTHLEGEDDMDQWWISNKKTFDDYKMKFDGCACITGYKGKIKNGQHLYQEEYEESQRKVETLITEKYLRVPWKMERMNWLIRTVKRCTIFLGYTVLGSIKILHDIFKSLSQKTGGVVQDLSLSLDIKWMVYNGQS
jgi:hypothetical protein